MGQQFTQWGGTPAPVQSQRPFPKGPVIWVVSIALGICLLGILLLYSGSVQRLFLAIEPSCTVGVTGTAATMTIQAWSANNDCNALVKNQQSFLGAPASQSGGFYLYTETPTNPVVCEVDDQGRHIIVRDEGVLKLVGSALCSALDQQIQQQQTPTSVRATATQSAQATQLAQATQTTQSALDQAVQQATQQLTTDLDTLTSAVQNLASASNYTDVLNAYAADWKQMQKDYQQEQADYRNGCGENGYNASVVSYDASTVSYDLSSIQYDDSSLQYDELGVGDATSPVQQGTQTVQADWQNLQNAVAADHGNGSPVYTQDQINNALANAQNQLTATNQATQTAQDQTTTYDKEASQLNTTAQNLANSLTC